MRLERCRSVAVLAEDATESGGNDAFTYIAACSGKHERSKFFHGGKGTHFFAKEKLPKRFLSHICHISLVFFPSLSAYGGSTSFRPSQKVFQAPSEPKPQGTCKKSKGCARQVQRLSSTSPKVVVHKSKGCRLQVQRLSSASWKHFHKNHLTNCLSATYKYIQDKSIKTPKSNSCTKSVREKSKCRVGFIRFFYVPLHPSTLCFIIKGLFEHEKQ